ncbi:hypothetical protein FFT09_19010 [Saccharomonospora piscinae]|nr:hypothetical protein FFT09_19010 [Saccharomonospora piscinae]
MNQGAGATVGGAMFGSGGSMSAEAMKNVSRSANELVASAKSGGFRVTKEAADPIIRTLEEFLNDIDGIEQELTAFDQAPPLGDHDYGKRVAQHMWDAANGDRSARSAVQQLREVLEKSRDALLFASNQYQAQEDEASSSFKGVGS